MINFWRSFDLSLINCEIELDLSQSKDCVICEILRRPEVGRDNPVDATQKIYATFQVNNGKLYVPVIILSINHNIKFLENIRQGFKRTLFWNRYRCEITTLPKYNNLDYLIHQHLEILIDCLFFHSKMLILREILLINPTGQI